MLEYAVEVVMMSEPDIKRVVIDFNVDDKWDDIKAFLKRASDIVSPLNRLSWCLDFTECAYLGPNAAVLIAGLYTRDLQRGLHPQVRLPLKSKKLVSFCAFVGLEYLVANGNRPEPDHQQSETVPLSTFYDPIANAESKVVQLVHKHFSELTEDAKLALGVAINEVIQNVCDHADSPFGAIMAARYFQNHHDVRVAILDLGVGIPATLSRVKPEAKDPVKALELVVKGGVSSRSKSNNMGLGISNLVAQIQLRRGQMLLISAGAVAILNTTGAVKCIQTPIHFPGTAVFFKMRVDDDDT